MAQSVLYIVIKQPQPVKLWTRGLWGSHTKVRAGSKENPENCLLLLAFIVLCQFPESRLTNYCSFKHFYKESTIILTHIGDNLTGVTPRSPEAIG